jgi:hypothetical protein
VIVMGLGSQLHHLCWYLGLQCVNNNINNYFRPASLLPDSFTTFTASPFRPDIALSKLNATSPLALHLSPVESIFQNFSINCIHQNNNTARAHIISVSSPHSAITKAS